MTTDPPLRSPWKPCGPSSLRPFKGPRACFSKFLLIKNKAVLFSFKLGVPEENENYGPRMTTKPSAVTTQIGRHTSWNDLTSFGSEITRLTGELLDDTTQMAQYIQITWEPRLRLWYHKRRTLGGRNLSSARICEQSGKWVCYCTTRTWYKKGDLPLHIDSYYQDGCDFNGSRTDAAVYSEDNFGLYYDGCINPKFRCTPSENDTTQIWIGGK